MTVQMTQAEFAKAFPQLADQTKRGDGSKYGKRHQAGKMNQTEAKYAELLTARKAVGEVLEFWFESITLKLADDLRFTTDFMVLEKDGRIIFVDVKGAGPIDPKSIVKAKMAAKMFPMWTFVMAKRQSKADGGGFVNRVFCVA